MYLGLQEALDEAPPIMERGQKLTCIGDCASPLDAIPFVLVFVAFIVAAWALFGRRGARRRKRPTP